MDSGNDQLRAGALGKPHVSGEDRRVALGAELEFLLDVSLEQGRAHRLAGGLGPMDVAQRLPDDDDCDESCCKDRWSLSTKKQPCHAAERESNK